MSKPLVGVDMRALVGPVSGIGFYTRSLVDRLARRDRASYLGLAHKRVAFEDELRSAGVRFDFRSAPLGVLWQQIVLPRRLRREGVDLLWSPLLTLPVTGNTPSVVTIHDLTPVVHPETHTFKVRLSTLPFLGRTVARARRIVADSEATADDIRRHFPRGKDKISVVYPGVDPEFVPGNETEIARTRRELGCEDGYVLFAGTLEPRKNVGFLLDAWEALRREGPSAPKLVLTGGYGWHSSRLLARIRRLERAGDLVNLERLPRNRLVGIFQAASVFVLPSLYEGFGLPAAEAMACGVPTIVTDTASLPEVVGDAGVTVPVGDTNALRSALSEVIRDPVLAGELGAKGRERARRFDWDEAARLLEEIFDEALR